MGLRDCRSISQALFSVFVRPSYTSLHSPWLNRPRLLPSSYVQNRGISLRDKQKFGPKGALSSAYVLDGQIGVRHIDLVHPDNTFEDNKLLYQAMREIDRDREHILLVKPAKENDPGSRPVCKRISKEDLQKMSMKAQQTDKLRKKQEKANKGKMLEIAWGTGEHDLSHKMKTLKEFLSAGRKVEIILLKKARKKVPENAHCQKVLDTVKETIAEVVGTKEYKPQEGALGTELILFLQGPTK